MSKLIMKQIQIGLILKKLNKDYLGKIIQLIICISLFWMTTIKIIFAHVKYTNHQYKK